MQHFKYQDIWLPALIIIAGSLTGCANGTSDANSSNIPAVGSVSAPPESISPEEPPIDNEQTAFYFSYDESTSTAARDLSLFAIDNGLRPAPTLGRAFEFLNAESFTTFDPQPVGPFSASFGMLATSAADLPTTLSTEESIYALGVNISGPTQTLEERRNVVLTLLVDVSGSMDSPYASETQSDLRSLLDVTRFGLSQLPGSLKSGDVINLVTFSTEATVLLESESHPSALYVDSVISLTTEGSTNINAGLQVAYQVANRTYDPQKANRVLILTDAFVNTGEVNPDVIAQQTLINGLEGIHFSGVGVGSSFNDSVLDILTDTGRGSYSAMITPDDAQRLFRDGFSRFVEPAVRDVRFRLSYPQQLDQFQSAAEQISVNAEDIQPVNFSYNSDQFFLELFTGPEDINADQVITLDIEYTDNEGQPAQASTNLTLAQLYSKGTTSIRSAAMVATLANVIAQNINCDTVLNSQLYTSPMEDAIYTRYREALGRFCAQSEPFNVLTF